MQRIQQLDFDAMREAGNQVAAQRAVLERAQKDAGRRAELKARDARREHNEERVLLMKNARVMARQDFMNENRVGCVLVCKRIE